MLTLQSEFRFAPSRRAALVIGAGAAVNAGAVFIIPIPLALQIAAAAALLAFFYVAGRERALLRGKNAVCGLAFRGRNEVAVLDARGAARDAGRLTYCSVSRRLTTAVIAGAARRHYVMILSDSLPANEYRHLRIQLNRAISDDTPQDKMSRGGVM